MDTFSNKKSIISFLNAVLPENVLKQIDRKHKINCSNIIDEKYI